MDELARRLWQKLVSWGQVETFVIDCLEGMNAETLMRMHRMARFLAQRQNKTWGPSYGPADKVAVMHLSDDSIIRQINEPKFKSKRRDWASGHGRYRDHNRSIMDLILEEAEYRGLKTDEQIRWESLRDMTPYQRTHAISKSLTSYECIERGGHKFMYDSTTKEHTCTNCRRKITDEEVMVRVNRECDGRLRLTPR